jgi:hypothetical protein
MRLGRSALAICLVVAASLSLPSVTPAQTSTSPTGDWSAIRTIGQGDKLEVKLKSGKTVKGKMVGVSDTALSLTVSDKATDISRDDVQSVYRVTSKSAAKSTLIGAGVGAGVGAAVGAATSDDDDFIFSRGQSAAVVGALGAGVGAIAGFAIGKSGRKRVLIYDAGRP